MLLNSGSTFGDGGFIVQTAATTGAPLFFDYESNRWGLGKEDSVAVNASNIGLSSNNVAAIVTVDVTSDNENTILTSTPIFGNTDATKAVQLVITTNPATDESPLYIYM